MGRAAADCIVGHGYGSECISSKLADRLVVLGDLLVMFFSE